MLSVALDSFDLLLLYPTTSISSHITIILISSLKHLKHHAQTISDLTEELKCAKQKLSVVEKEMNQMKIGNSKQMPVGAVATPISPKSQSPSSPSPSPSPSSSDNANASAGGSGSGKKSLLVAPMPTRAASPFSVVSVKKSVKKDTSKVDSSKVDSSKSKKIEEHNI
jgi:hypothetical protein